jgi:hypothetical protein
MNRIKKILTGLLMIVGLFSCDYLDVIPDQIPTLDNAFSDRSTTLRYLSSCYWALPRSGWNGNPGWCAAMEMVVNRQSMAYQPMQMAMGNDNASLALMNYWSNDVRDNSGGSWPRSLYAGIRECNTLLENIDRVGDIPVSERQRMIAEAKMLKACMHFYLICLYGPICPLRESLPVGEEVEAPYREKVDACFQYVLDLLNEVIDSDALPTIISSKNTELGRFTKAAAYAFKAKVLVYWASNLFNGNTDYNAFVDHNGEPFFNQQYDALRWNIAAEACRQAIQACAEGQVRLYTKNDYQSQGVISDTTLQLQTLRSALTETWYTNPEIIWGNYACPMSDIAWACIPRLESSSASVYGQLSVPFSTVDLFYSNHGVPITEDIEWQTDGQKKYNERFGTRQGDADHKYYLAEGETTSAMNFDREPRFYSSLGFDRGKWYGNYYRQLPDIQAPVVRCRWGEYSSGILPDGYNCTGYYPKKLANLGTMFESANTIMFVEYAADIRYADLLLLYAEAVNETAHSESTRPDPIVYTVIDEIRARAGLEGIEKSYSEYAIHPEIPANKEGMREIIRRERKIELALEGQYYWDCRRWKTAAVELNRSIRGYNPLQNAEADYYKVTTVYEQRFTSRDYFCPIPEGDFIKNPRLIQNPGY